ncbi:hypothetical protein AAFH96_35365 [Polymorphospora sp. 2-325]|uniref:Uncharacterized protein n=2 Tax=Polymorphospora TaxID=338583 RepID=A0ABV5D224_9ACTN
MRDLIRTAQLPADLHPAAVEQQATELRNGWLKLQRGFFQHSRATIEQARADAEAAADAYPVRIAAIRALIDQHGMASKPKAAVAEPEPTNFGELPAWMTGEAA